ncbi:MotA/TolQ/ExbB proton channel family protein [uncultured Photobacterium sp.]|uniref:MotA/TolQ/ExbB proton channel family protein n=1 Tax=uncultured Photobacterium sp. TaxID=173973 RepID=UPI0026034EC8|nr:MotA/TolQ/ExbB proton channel family protein [uncultured Photobacterium sp.]
MKKIILIMISAVITNTGYSNELDSLLKKVQQGYQQEIALDKAQLEKFKALNTQQIEATNAAKKRLTTLNIQTDQFISKIDHNRNEIAELTRKLAEESADLQQVFKQLNSAASELDHHLKNSMLSAQFPDEQNRLTPLLNTKYQPNSQDIQHLWAGYLLQMVESGKIASFDSSVVLPNGAIEQRLITRLGTFTAFDQNGYVRYLENNGAFMLLPKQPQGKPLDLITQFEQQTSGPATVTIDPSRGTLIAIAGDQPDNWQRIQQAGVVGYLILLVGCVGLIISAIQGIRLFRQNKQIQHQRMNLDQPGDNPLGRILKVGRQTNIKAEQLSRLLDEVVLGEIPLLKKGLPTLAVLAGIAPLLGLLGTVSGMIETFQAITAFGNGSPKILSSGISQALLTTALGLVVSIPLVLIHCLLNNKSNALIHILEHQGAGLIALREVDESHDQ